MENIDVVTLAVQLVGGVIGAVLAGAILSPLSLGGFGNTLAGLIGGGVSAHILATKLALNPAIISAGMEPIDIAAQAGSGAAGGAIAVIVIGILRAVMA